MENMIDVINSAITDINGLILQGVLNWQNATNAVKKLNSVVVQLKKQQERKEAAYNAAIEDAKKQKEKAKVEIGELTTGG